MRRGEANSHAGKGWELLTQKVIDTVAKVRTMGVVFLAWGTPAQNRTKGIPVDKHLILKSVHPSPLSAARGFVSLLFSSGRDGGSMANVVYSSIAGTLPSVTNGWCTGMERMVGLIGISMLSRRRRVFEVFRNSSRNYQRVSRKAIKDGVHRIAMLCPCSQRLFVKIPGSRLGLSNISVLKNTRCAQVQFVKEMSIHLRFYMHITLIA